MFSNLRQGSLLYVLNKAENPKLMVGQVVSVGQPQAKYGTTNYMHHPNYETVVDIVAKVGDEEMKFEKLPSHLSIANFGTAGMVVSESKEAMNAEVESMLRTSQMVLESMPYHEKVVGACDAMLRELNPQFAKEKEQEEKIGQLERKMDGMGKTLADISVMLNRVLKKE